MINKQDLPLFSDDELINLRTALTEELVSRKGNALERESFEAQLEALKVLVEACDPESEGISAKAKLLDSQLADLERIVAYANDYEQEIQSLYDQIQALLPRWKQVLNRALGGRRRVRFRFVFFVRRQTRNRFSFRINNIGFGAKQDKII